MNPFPKLLYVIFLGLFVTQLNAQTQLPLIHAKSDMVDIRDGDELNIGGWTLAPEYKPDVYTSNKKGEWVTFYTDVDSIRYKIHPDSVYDFIILLNGKDSAYTQIRYQASYLDILKGAGDYNANDKITFPGFTYQDSSNAALKTLRKELKLDSIAGGGNEVSRIINLMHWIHDLVPHDGSHGNPVVKNAMSMIEECKRDERGLNCRGLATVLNECYLSLGIKSRFVTCMPKDSVFDDCHVINMVYSNDLDKWIWIDPTNDAYIMDENGTLLGLEEVRERLINGKTLILNPDANWNHRESTVKEHYLHYYMAKNLYRFECPLSSEYDTETPQKGKHIEYIALLPLDGLNQTPKVRESKNSKTGVSYKTYKTNSPEVFWAKPE
jgi:transglutaminase-like putative cysteine protease